MLFTQAAKLKPWFCSGNYRPFLATPKLLFSMYNVHCIQNTLPFFRTNGNFRSFLVVSGTFFWLPTINSNFWYFGASFFSFGSLRHPIR
jgi:hypothetical protein